MQECNNVKIQENQLKIGIILAFIEATGPFYYFSYLVRSS